MATETLHPDAETPQPPWGYRTWTASAGTKTECVAAEDADYIHHDTAFAGQGFSLADTSASSGKTINSVTQYARALGQTSNDEIRLELHINGSGYLGSTQIITTSYAEWSEEWLNNPDDSNPWESADIDGTITIIMARGGTGDWRCDHFWGVVDYEAAAEGPTMPVFDYYYNQSRV